VPNGNYHNKKGILINTIMDISNQNGKIFLFTGAISKPEKIAVLRTAENLITKFGVLNYG